jgi:hypothetical protein
MSTICSSPKTLCESEFKGDHAINPMKEISRQHSIQFVVSVLLLDSWSQLYREN